jgi:hypothetical protein
MAISPNDDFTAGAVLTAEQQNRFPRGVMAFNTNTTTNAGVTGEATQITATAFTAVANRYYKITYFEPDCLGGTGYFTFKIKKGATVLQTFYQLSGAGVDRHANGVYIGTFSAGSVTITATAEQSAGTGTLGRGSSTIAFLSIEDIGPA